MRPSEILAAKADEIREIIARYPVRNPRIFGSAARGDDEEGSECDVLVDPLENTSLYGLAGLELELADLLGFKVDVVTPKGLAPDVARRVGLDIRPLGAARTAVLARTGSGISCSGANVLPGTSTASPARPSPPTSSVKMGPSAV